MRSRSRSTTWPRSRRRWDSRRHRRPRSPHSISWSGSRSACRGADPGGRSGRRRGGVGRALPGNGRARPRWRRRKPPLGTKALRSRSRRRLPSFGGAGRHRGDRAHHPRHRSRPRGVRGVWTGDGAAPRSGSGTPLSSARRPRPTSTRTAPSRRSPSPADGGPDFVRAGGHGRRRPNRRPLGDDPVGPGLRDAPPSPCRPRPRGRPRRP